MKIDDLLGCTVKMLTLLAHLFNSGKISFDELEKHSRQKLNFLESSLEESYSERLKSEVNQVLLIYKKLFMGSGQTSNIV